MSLVVGPSPFHGVLETPRLFYVTFCQKLKVCCGFLGLLEKSCLVVSDAFLSSFSLMKQKLHQDQTEVMWTLTIKQMPLFIFHGFYVFFNKGIFFQRPMTIFMIWSVSLNLQIRGADNYEHTRRFPCSLWRKWIMFCIIFSFSAGLELLLIAWSIDKQIISGLRLECLRFPLLS